MFGFRSVHFSLKEDIPSLKGKVVLVTGGNSGLGKQCVLEYARHGPAQIWLAARNLDKAKAAVDEIKRQVPDAPIKILQLDLSSFESVKGAARVFSSESDRLDILMLDAGIMAAKPGLTGDGYEVQFETNYLGHALLTQLLLPVLLKTAKVGSDVHIVAVSSHGHMFAPSEGVKFDKVKTLQKGLGPFGRYGQSKLAFILWARQLAKEYPQFTVASVHPGLVRTHLILSSTGLPFLLRAYVYVAGIFVTPVKWGAKNQLWASVSKDVKSGEYYNPVGVRGGLMSAKVKDDDLAKKIWDWTETQLEGQLT
jgi:NAD(P)-dependent dehydrogenase (short-subunit alcohol dehydrogenase family)